MPGRRVVLFVTSVAFGALAGCAPASNGAGIAAPHARPTTTVAAPVTTSPPSTEPPPFTSSVTTVTAAELGASWHPGCPVDPTQLRDLELSYWGFDGQAHTGTMVVNASVVNAIIQVFTMLYNARFPISEMIPQSAYGGDDNDAAAADDTSGFNCRYAVAPGPPQWSMHAYGEAVDVNDVQNPYVDGSTIIPPAGAAYLNRGDARPGMAVPGGTLVDAFTAIGWGWGGNWTGATDYQHFSINGH